MKITDNGGIGLVRWTDNSIVALASSFSGKNEVDESKTVV